MNRLMRDVCGGGRGVVPRSAPELGMELCCSCPIDTFVVSCGVCNSVLVRLLVSLSHYRVLF